MLDRLDLALNAVCDVRSCVPHAQHARTEECVRVSGVLLPFMSAIRMAVEQTYSVLVLEFYTTLNIGLWDFCAIPNMDRLCVEIRNDAQAASRAT